MIDKFPLKDQKPDFENLLEVNIGNSFLGLLQISNNLPQFPPTDFVK